MAKALALSIRAVQAVMSPVPILVSPRVENKTSQDPMASIWKVDQRLCSQPCREVLRGPGRETTRQAESLSFKRFCRLTQVKAGSEQAGESKWTFPLIGSAIHVVVQNKEPLLIRAPAAHPTGYRVAPEMLLYESGRREEWVWNQDSAFGSSQ